MLLKINPESPEIDKVLEVVECLRKGGVVIYPTDSVYGLGCDISNRRAVERLCRIKGLEVDRVCLTCICESVKDLAYYTKRLSTPLYKIVKQAFPGPYTFILPPSKQIPKHFKARDGVGFRVVDHRIPSEIVHYLGKPITSFSLVQLGVEMEWEYYADPALIHEIYGDKVDIVVDGGYGNMLHSTVIDCSEGLEFMTVIRQGMGELDKLGIELV